MKAYIVSVETINKGKSVGYKSWHILSPDARVSEDIVVHWSNLSKVYERFGLALPFNCWSRKKGTVVSFFDNHIFPPKQYRAIKSWKEELDMTIHVNYKEFTPSLSWLINWHDSKQAIEYLKEFFPDTPLTFKK